MRKLALDLGDARIGVAQSDLMGIIANGLETIVRTSLQEDLIHIVNLVKNNAVDTVVLGLPINMDGSKGERVEKTYAFSEELKKVLPSNVKIDFIDERLTTVSAERVLLQADVSRKKRKTVIDKMAATIMGST